MLQGLGLVFVAVYQRALKLLYVDELLERMKAEFPKHYQPKCFDYPAFTDSFEKARAELEGAADANKRGVQPKPPLPRKVNLMLFCLSSAALSHSQKASSTLMSLIA